MTQLLNQVAPVTGASRGIGTAIARRFALAGARVALHGRDVASLDAVLRRVCEDGGEATVVVGDRSLGHPGRQAEDSVATHGSP